jgi:hypothetical protein
LSRHLWQLICLVFLLVAGCKRVSKVDPDAAAPLAATFWQSLRNNDVPNAIELYDSSLWLSDPELRSRWFRFLRHLEHQGGAVGSAEIKSKQWFPASDLVSDHRAFVCYAYDYDVKRPKLESEERLVICGEPRAPASEMRIFGHTVKRLDTQQSVGIGVDDTEKEL